MSTDLRSLFSRSKSNYITLNGVKGNQFNHEVITIQCTVNDVLKFLEIDRNVQRDLDENKVASISKYIQYGLDGNDIYFSPLIFSARGKGDFYEENNEYRLGMDERLIILDGQHRIKAFEHVKKRIEISDEEDKNRHEMLVDFPITLQIFTDLTLEQERQLFTDINTKSSQVNNTLLIMYKKDDLYGELTKEVIASLPYDLIECRAKTTRTKLMTAATLYSVAKTINHGVYLRQAKVEINNENYDRCKERVRLFIKLLREYGPIGAIDRNKYIIMSSNIIVAIAKFIYDTQKKYPEIKMEKLFKEVISKIDWSHKNDEFKKLSIKYNKKTKKYNFGSTGRTIRDFSEYLNDIYEKGVGNSND